MGSWNAVRAGIEERRFADPIEFLGALEASSSLWGDTPDAWIFRGHSDASWELLPAAHRPEPWNALAKQGEVPFVPGDATEEARLSKEQAVLQDFLEALDVSGIPVPLEYRLPGRLRGLGNEKPLALAQHYGLPTRLLDWSRQPNVAAYFACLRPRGAADELAVWALHASCVSKDPTRRDECVVIQTTRADNPNLHAQDGLFTCAQVPNGDNLKAKAIPRIDLLLSDIVAGVTPLGPQPPTIPDPILRKFILPREHDQKLMRALHQRRVTASRVFPGLIGVAMTVRERLQFGVVGPGF